MSLPLAIYTATHGLGWNWQQSDISLSELESCRAAFGRLPDFDSGDIGFEGVAVLGERVFVVRCFRAVKWDFLGRDAIYLATTWLPLKLLGGVDLEALFALRQFREPMRNPPSRFELEIAESRVGTTVEVANIKLRDGVVLRRDIGEMMFTPIPGMDSSVEIEPLPIAPPSLMPTKDNSHLAVKRSRLTTLMWLFLIVVTVLALSCYVLLKETWSGKEGVTYDGSGKTVERSAVSESNERPNNVSSRTISDEESIRRCE